MAQVHLPLPQVLPEPRGLCKTRRTDNWKLEPILVFLGFSAFIVYATWAAFQGQNFYADKPTVSLWSGVASSANYLSPMYSPLLFDMPGGPRSGHAWFGDAPGWMASIPFFTPALLILWAPGGFRFTCYYYRGAYYKAFWGDPISCSVGEPGFRGKNYRGERWLPLVLQNAHRYFFYLAVLFIFILSYDAIISYIFKRPGGGSEFGLAVGSLVLTINPILLGCYTFGCHSMRHLIGGRQDEVSKSAAGGKAYDCVSCLNRRHMLFAWLSLFWVGFTDFYVRMCSVGLITDYRII
ncbi:MAG: succinate dehydrogenase [Phycisphaerales bacterium]